MNDTIDPTAPAVRPLFAPIRRIAVIVALCVLSATLTATWLSPSPAAAERTAPGGAAEVKADDDDATEDTEPAKPAKAKAKAKAKGKSSLSGKLNLNTATVEQLSMLPGVGPSKAERVLVWRKKNGGFKRVADLRKVKGFGYKTLKKLEKYLDIKGDTTLTAK